MAPLMRGRSRPHPTAVLCTALVLTACGIPPTNDASIDARRETAVTDATARDWNAPDIERSDVMFPRDVAAICPTNEDGIVREIIRPRCATSRCHTATARAGELDLESANLVARLTDAPALGCAAQILLVEQAPERSYLYRKMADPSPACGEIMPPPDAGVGLRLNELECIRLWITGIGRVDAGPQIDVRDVPISTDVMRDTVSTMDVARDTPTPSDASAMDIVRDTPTPMDVPRDVLPTTDVPAPIDVPRDVPIAVDVLRDSGVDAPGSSG